MYAPVMASKIGLEVPGTFLSAFLSEIKLNKLKERGGNRDILSRAGVTTIS